MILSFSFFPVSLPEIPVEMAKKKKRKRKSRENVNNVSDSEIQFNNGNLDRYSRKAHLLNSTKRLSVSAADYVGKSREELILMLIQLRRKQSQLEKTCEQLRLQMDSEEKMMEIEPFRKEDYQFRFNELNRQWLEVNREYELHIPIIQTIDHMIQIKSKSKLNEMNKKKAASTSVLDQVLNEENKELANVNSQSGDIDCDSNQTGETPNDNIEILKRQQRALEGELDRVRGMLTHSTKKLEEKAVENAQMEQEMLLARNKLKQVLENEQEAMEITRSSKLEAELAHINKVIDDLHSRRQELNNAIENLKNSETNFISTNSFHDQLINDDNYPNYEFSPEETSTAIAESNLYPLYENIKSSQEFIDINSNENPHNNKETDDTDDDVDNNNLNDEFFTLNINLDKHPLKTIKSKNEINNNGQNHTINTMCEFDPNKDMILAYGDSIVDQQIKQIYNYQHGILMPKSNDVKTVREVKRESERRKFNNQQLINRSNAITRNYEPCIQLSNHYLNETNDAFENGVYLNNSDSDLKNMDQVNLNFINSNLLISLLSLDKIKSGFK